MQGLVTVNIRVHHTETNVAFLAMKVIWVSHILLTLASYLLEKNSCSSTIIKKIKLQNSGLQTTLNWMW